VVAWSSARGGPAAWWAWLMLAVYMLADVGILFGGRSQFDVALGLIGRYAADLTPVMALALAGALHDAPLPGRIPAGRRPAVALGLALLAAVTTVPSAAALSGPLLNRDDRTYATNLLHQLRRAPDTVLFDANPPLDVMVPWFGDRARVSTVLATMPRAPRLDVPSVGMEIPDDRGILRPITVRNPVTSVRGPSRACGYPVGPRGLKVFLDRLVLPGRHVARFDYFAGRSSLVTARFDGVRSSTSVQLPADAGLHSVFVPVDAGFSSIHVNNDDGHTTVCLGQVVIGTPAPAAAR
jgi:hypothetical protein